MTSNRRAIPFVVSVGRGTVSRIWLEKPSARRDWALELSNGKLKKSSTLALIRSSIWNGDCPRHYDPAGRLVVKAGAL